MPHGLIALGSNLGNRQQLMRQALLEIARLAGTRLTARSAWRETLPAGGPAGQGAFLNAAALVTTRLAPEALLAELHRIETSLGRQRHVRWAARAVDLDLLLFGDVSRQTPELAIPHPRMAFRRFVLEPAAEAAPWMVHSESGWTVQRLLEHLNCAGDSIAVAAAEESARQTLVSGIARRLELSSATSDAPPAGRPTITCWSPAAIDGTSARPKLLLALVPSAGVNSRDWRRMLHLPPDGPVAWIGQEASLEPLREAIAAVQSVWPTLATTPTPSE